MDDAGLVSAVMAGDQAAFAEIYDRYADRIHDFCWSVLRDREEAADAMQDTFVLAAERLGQLRDPSKLRAWLFAIARNEAIKRGKARQRSGPGRDEMAEVPSSAPGPEAIATQDDLRQVVWQAAEGLSDRDRVILDLNVRQGLEGQELADALGVTADHGHVLLSRLRDQVERSLGALLVARLGKDECEELAGVLRGWDGRFSPLVRKRVARHVDGCDVCSDRRRKVASPLALLSAVPLLPAPTTVREEVLAKVELVSRDGRPWPGGKDGFPPPMTGTSRRRRPILGAAVAAVVLVIVAVITQRGGEDPQRLQATGAEHAGVTTTTDPAPTNGETFPEMPPAASVPEPPGEVGPTTVPETPLPPGPGPGPGPSAGSLLVTPAVVDLGAATSATIMVGNDGGSLLQWRTSRDAAWLSVSPAAGEVEPSGQESVAITVDRDGLAEGVIEGTVTFAGDGGVVDVKVSARTEHPPVVRASVQPIRLAADGCTPSVGTVSATVTDESAIELVTLHWVAPGGSSSSRVMTASRASYVSRIGPFPDAGTATWWVEAIDSRGNSGTSPRALLPVGGCALR